MNRSESKYYHTACLMDEALLHLLSQKDYDYITVKEICERAGVNRSTFYLHYETIDDLLKESLDYILSQFFALYSGSAPIRPRRDALDDLYLITPKYILPFLAFLREHKRIFMAALEKPDVFRVSQSFDRAYASVFEPILERYQVDEHERKYLLAFHLRGMFAIITEWLRGDCREPASYIADLLTKYTLPARVVEKSR